VTKGKKVGLTRAQISGLQLIYLNTLASVYKQTRSLYFKLLKHIKPSAYIEIQGVQSQYRSVVSSERESAD